MIILVMKNVLVQCKHVINVFKRRLKYTQYNYIIYNNNIITIIKMINIINGCFKREIK